MLSLLAIACLAPAPALPGPSAPAPQVDLSSRPDAGNGPTRVSVGVFVIDVKEIDEKAQTLRIDFHLSLRWKDPRVAGAPLARMETGNIWTPLVQVMNQQDLRNHLPDEVEVDADGTVHQRMRLSGTLSAAMHLQDFPLDEQELIIDVSSVRFDRTEVELVADAERSGGFARHSIAGWSIGAPGFAPVVQETVAAQGRSFTRLSYAVPARRLPTFFVWKVFVPLGLIVFMAWAVFWVDPSQFGPQVGVATGAVFTMVAFQIGLGRLLPPVPYLTRMDRYVIGCTVLVFLAVGEAILTSRLAATGSADRAHRIDLWARGVYPVLFVVVIGASVLL